MVMVNRELEGHSERGVRGNRVSEGEKKGIVRGTYLSYSFILFYFTS
jgi:hypothetical protein